MKRVTLAVCLLVGLVGCKEDATSLSRDYRNLANEYLDALMFSTTEDKAKVMLEKIVNRYDERIKNVDTRMQVWEQNNEKEVVAASYFNSDSMVMYHVECEPNLERLNLELERLNMLSKTSGSCPSIEELANPSKHDNLRKNLKDRGKCGEMRNKIVNEWDLPKKNAAIGTLWDSFQTRTKNYEFTASRLKNAKDPG